MPLLLFDRNGSSALFENLVSCDEFGHTFGGNCGSFGIRIEGTSLPIHLLYRLNLSDPKIDIRLPGLTWLPLIYGFAFHVYEGDCNYRIVSDTKLQVVTATEADWDPDYPYDKYPSEFPETSISFAYNHASQSPDFPQGLPDKSCDNQQCTARIIEHVEPHEEPIVDPAVRKMLGRDSYTIDGYDIREDSMRMFAVHQPSEKEVLFWGDAFTSLIFQICECCNCIRVSNQCT